jgi:uncharacterized protein (TIGR04551 family)
MRRLLALLLAAGLAPAPAAAQQKGTSDRPAGKGEVGPEVQAAIDQAKEELREEMRSRAQDQALAAGDHAPSDDGRKMNLFQVSGYLRLRGDLFDELSLRRGPDSTGYYLFPPPLSSPDKGTLTSGNLRLRLEPILNVSDQVRVLAQVDLLDGILLGQEPFRPAEGARADRDSIRVKRAWGEVQTPVGLASFGRMPSQWGVGVVAHAGAGIDDDLGSTVDRLQLAIPLRQTFLGALALVPYYQVNSAGIAYAPVSGVGQPVDVDKADDNWSTGLRAVRLDTEDELARKLARGESSWNYGAWYQFTSQRFDVVLDSGTPIQSGAAVTAVKIGASQHLLDLWLRYRTQRLRVEVEAAGVYGNVDDARLEVTDPALGPVALRQWGAVLQADYRFLSGRLTAGLEAGVASGDDTPGMGNRPERGLPAPGSIDGSQVGRLDGTTATYDRSIRNFRFNPAYRVDLVLWREILGTVTDAWYLRPSVRYDVLDGLSLRGAVVYSQAMAASSTPSSVHRPLGLEIDLGVHYLSGDGFHLWLDWGVLQPLDGLGYPPGQTGTSLSRGHALRSGIAIQF